VSDSIDDGVVRARLRAAVPAEVREVCDVLTRAGHQAVTVGGAVRDAMLGRSPGDWDVATSARPEEVQGLFKRTIPTGIEHGTVTVMVGKGERRMGVEVTTFRGEGAYTDARRPDSVVFGVPLREDLARRDFVINAIAYDPIADAVFDPFGGQADLAARRLRAVGDAVARFTEDGLRVMRAVRFAAVLELELDAETEAGIAPALPSLRKVSQERVHDELVKLFAARRPSIGLVIARRSGVLEVILPELAVSDEAWAGVLARVDAARGGAARFAALLAEVGAAAAVDGALRRLKLSNEDRERIGKAAGAFAAVRAGAGTDVELRRVLAAVGRRWASDVVEVWRAEGEASRDPVVAERAARATAILERGDALAVGELALGGGDLMKELGLAPGRRVGELLAALLDRVLDEPALNERAQLVALARAL
jgi:tRNA nucleotidyltransferase (CCA-adding enzyme)